MATDLATLAIKVENGDVIKTTTALNSMEVAGTKAEASTTRLTRRMALLEIEARRMDAEMAKNATTIGKLKGAIAAAETAVPGLTAALGALSAVAALGFIGKKTLEETEQAQAAMAQLEAAVKSTGGAAGRTVAQLDALSVSLQKTTTFSDEAVKGAEKILLTFDQIRGAEFDRATQAVTDLAARMGGDLETAALQLGKALQDPTNGLAALRRSGVSFSAAQVDVIKSLYETGRVAEGQRAILAELEKQFGGSAAAARDTLGGALAALKNAWGDLFEVSREASQGTVTGINAITHALESSGLSMNKILKDATVDWETMRASIQKVREILSLPIGPGFFERARNIIERIDFDLSVKIAELNKPAAIGPAVTPPPRGSTVSDDALRQRKKDLDELQKATDAYYNSLNQHQIDAIHAADTTRVQNDQIRALIAAYGESQDAVERVTIAQAGDNAVRALAVGVSQKVADAVRREAEEHERLSIALGKVKDAQAESARQEQQAADEAQREMERRAKELHRTVSSTIEGILTDLDHHRNPGAALWENLKRGAIKAVSDILAEKWDGKIADILGIQIPATKQEKAAKEMNTAADKMLRAAGIMNSADGTVADAGTIFNPQKSAVARYLEQIGKVAGAGYGGYQAGYGIGQATGSRVLGAVGGAFTGAKLGAAIAGPVGAAVGGLAGFVGGILGAGDAAKEAAAKLEAAKISFKNSWDAIVAEINGDTLAGSIAGAKDRFQQLKQQYADTLNAWEIIHGKLATGIQDISKLEDEYIAKLKEEAAAKERYFSESLDVRILRAQGKTKEADALELRNQQEQERDEFRRTHNMVDDPTTHEDDATVAQNIADYNKLLYAQSLELRANTKALSELNTTVRGGPSGFKLNGYVQQYGAGLPHPAAPLPWTPPMLPVGLTPPNAPQFSQSSSTGKAAPAPIVLNNPVFQFPNIVDGKVAAKAFLGELDKTVAATGGLNTTRAVALNKMTVA